jgi:hypothetical protein
MLLRDLRTPEQIVRALTDARDHYAALAGEAASRTVPKSLEGSRAGLAEPAILSRVNLLMIRRRSILDGKRGAFWYTLQAFSREWDRIDVSVPIRRAPARCRRTSAMCTSIRRPRGLVSIPMDPHRGLSSTGSSTMR